jgi:ABC-type transport system involved in multi-copper enzyme maturation permease subunit
VSRATAILAIARNTFRVAARNKVLYSLLFFAVLLIVSALALGELSLNEEVRMTRDVGLFGIDLFSVLIAIFVGVNLLYKELDLKTVYTILPKPIARWEFVLGKWLGMLITLALQIAVMGAVLALTTVAEGGALDGAIAKALWLLMVNVTVVTSVAILFSSFSSPFLSGFFALGVFVVGRSVPDIRLVAARASGAVARAIDLASYLVPNLHLFYPSGALIGASRASIHASYVASGYLLSTTIYGLGYSAAVLGLAMLIFRRRDFV